MKKYIVSLITFIALFYSGNVAFAQNLNDGDISNDVCINLQTSILRFKSNDASTNGEVSLLQDFLIEKGYLTGSPTGFYGRMTVNAVKSYQREIGVSPTGNVGPLTNSFIMRETCDGAQPLPVPVVISPGNGVKSFTFYKVSEDKKRCLVSMFVGNVGLVNGMYVYKSGEFATEAECRNALGVISQDNQLSSAPSITGLSINNDGMGDSLYITGNNLNKVSIVCYEVRADGEQCQRSFSAQTNNKIIIRLEQNMSTVPYELIVKAVDEKNNLTSNKMSIARSPITVSVPSITGLSINNDGMGESLYVTGNNLSKVSVLCLEVRVDGEQCQRSFNAQTNNQIIIRLGQNTSTVPYELFVKAVDEKNNLTSNKMSIARSPTTVSGTSPSCSLTTDKSSYKLGETIILSWTSQNATYTTFQQNNSGKDGLWLPGDKLTPSGLQPVAANVIGNPDATLLVYNYTGSNSCRVVIPVTQ